MAHIIWGPYFVTSVLVRLEETLSTPKSSKRQSPRTQLSKKSLEMLRCREVRVSHLVMLLVTYKSCKHSPDWNRLTYFRSTHKSENVSVSKTVLVRPQFMEILWRPWAFWKRCVNLPAGTVPSVRIRLCRGPVLRTRIGIWMLPVASKRQGLTFSSISMQHLQESQTWIAPMAERTIAVITNILAPRTLNRKSLSEKFKISLVP